jgi:hypothetical protein
MQERKRFVVPVLVILLGITWLLNVLEIVPGIDWIWTIGLAAIGILSIILGKIDKLTIVVGPWFVAASICSLLRQTDKLEINREVPILTIILGCLLLLSAILKLPASTILTNKENKEE